MHLWLIWGWEEESAVLSMKLFNSKTLIEISALFLLLANGCLLGVTISYLIVTTFCLK